MAIALIVTIVLSVLILIGALLIGKSSLSYNDKIVSLIITLAIFCLIPIINEARKPNYEETKLSEPEFEKYFFIAPEHAANDKHLPILDDHNTIITDSLGGWNGEDPDSYEFGLVYSNQKVGKTVSFKEYTKHLQQIGIPSLYVSLKSSNIEISQFADALKIPTMAVLDDAIDNFNLYGKIPNIFIDNIDNGFTLNAISDYSFPCSVCEYMKALYDVKKVNVFFITNKPIIKDILESNEAYNKRMGFYEFKVRPTPTLEAYLIDKINDHITANKKKFDSNTVNLFLQSLGWDFDVLSEYIKNNSGYQDVNDFIKSVIDEEAKRISSYSDLEHLLKSIADLNSEKHAEWISYASIRQTFGENPSQKLEEAVRANILAKSHNLFKFISPITHNAVSKIFEFGSTIGNADL